MKKKIYSMLSVFTIVSVLSVPLAIAGSVIRGDVINNNNAAVQHSSGTLGGKAYTGAIGLKDVLIRGEVTNNNTTMSLQRATATGPGSEAATGSIVLKNVEVRRNGKVTNNNTSGGQQTSTALFGGKAYTGAIVLKDTEIRGHGEVINNNDASGIQTSFASFGGKAVTGSIVAE